MRRVKVAACVTLALALGGCKSCTNQTEAPVYLRIVQVEASAGGFGDDFGAYLHSDVLYQDPDGTSSSVFPDTARLTVMAIPKNPGYADDWGGEPTALQDVRLERYDVVYTRGDGRNVAGVDVPYPINGPMSAWVPFDGGVTQAMIEVVRHAAKEEPPLKNLVYGNNDDIFTCIATITIHGRTGTDAVVEASGLLQITFANFGNE